MHLLCDSGMLSHILLVDSILLLNIILLYNKLQLCSHSSFDGHFSCFHLVETNTILQSNYLQLKINEKKNLFPYLGYYKIKLS